MKPLIGISPSMEVDEAYYMIANDNVKAIESVGGLPIVLTYTEDDDVIEQLAQQIDGLYATGGHDIDPTLFGEEPHPQLGTIIPARDAFELKLIKKMMLLDKPVLGVCRGIQILNIAAGGDMYQDMYSQTDNALLQHAQKAPKAHGSHFVEVEADSLLYRLTKTSKLRVNSRHHQANRSVKEPIRVSGKASDGVIEAIESSSHRFVLGLQWHPENMLPAGDAASYSIFQGFIDACR